MIEKINKYKLIWALDSSIFRRHTDICVGGVDGSIGYLS
jgi:hypothetical protein